MNCLVGELSCSLLKVWGFTGNKHEARASTNFQILEVLNFLPLKLGGSTENFRKFQFATRFYRNSSICILFCLYLFLDIFNRTFMSLLWLWLSWVSSLFCFNNFHRRVGCFVSVLIVFFFLPFFFLLFYLFFFFFSFKLSRLHWIFYFLTGQNVENAHLHHKNIHTCAFIWENVLAFRGTTDVCRTCVLTGRRIQASQTGLTKHLGSVNGSSRGSQTKIFVSLSAAEADQKRPM